MEQTIGWDDPLTAVIERDYTGISVTLDPLPPTPGINGVPIPREERVLLPIDEWITSLRRQINAVEKQHAEVLANRAPYERDRAEALRLINLAQGYFQRLDSDGSDVGIDLKQAAEYVAAERIAKILDERSRAMISTYNDELRDLQERRANTEAQLTRLLEEEPRYRREHEQERLQTEWAMQPARVWLDPLRPHEALVVLNNGQQLTRLVADLPFEWRRMITPPR